VAADRADGRGLAIVRLCTTIPHVGGWVKFAAILWGIGAISLSLYRRFEPVDRSKRSGCAVFASDATEYHGGGERCLRKGSRFLWLVVSGKKVGRTSLI